MSKEYFIDLFLPNNLYIIGYVFIIVLLIYVLKLKNNNKDLQKKINKLEAENLYKYNRLSMIEYQVRIYKEGGNAYTVLRDIGSILFDVVKGGKP